MSEQTPHPSLALRLSLTVGLSSAVLGVAALALIAGLYVQRSHAHMEEHARNTAAFLAESLEYPLWSLDLAAVKAIGQALAQDHLVGLVEVAGPRDETYYRQQTSSAFVLERRAPVVHDGQTIGWVRVGLNDHELNATLWLVVLSGAGMAALVILLQYLLHALFFRPLLGKPFASLDRLIAAYAAGDFSPAPPAVTYAEFAPLFRLLVDMGGTIRRQVSALKASEERLALALDAANDGMWDWDLPTGATYFSPRYASMLGYAAGDIPPNHGSFLDLLHPGDRGRLDEALAAALDGLRPYETEFRLLDKSGQWRWVLSRGRVVERDESGRPRRMVGTHVDITARKALEQRLADQLSFQQALMDTLPYAVFYKGADTRFLGFNRAYEATFGVRREDLLGKRVLDLEYLPPADRAAYQAEDEAVIAAVGRVQKEMPIPFADGRVHQTLYSVNGFRQADGTPGGLIGVIVDITACKEAEEALRRSEEKYRLLVENQTDLVVKVDAGGHFLYVSPSYCRTFGRPEEDLLGKTFMPLVHEDDLPATREAMLALHHPPHTAYMEQRARTVGGWRWFAWNDTAVLGPDGAIREVLGVGRDITARKEAEEALAASEKRFRTLFEVAQDSILVLRGGRIEDCNRSTEELLGRPRDAIVGREPAELSPAVQPNGADSLQYQRQLLAETTSGKRLLFDWSFLHPGGALVAVEVALQSIAGEAPGLLLAMVRDVTERRRQERLLRQSEEKFSRLFRLSPDNVLLSEVESGKLVEANESFLSFHGLTREQAIGSTIAELGLYGDIRRRQDLVRILRQNGRVENFEMEVLRHDGSLRVGLLSAQMMEIEGRPLMMSMLRDITETKRMQEMMVQTEKMISVGGIAAGVAHEINNPLGIVLQATQNLVRRTRPDLPRNISAARAIGLDMELLRRYMQERKLDAFIEDIQSAAVRAAAIIRHMLDFSRHSESRRKVCDLPGIVRKAMDLAKSDYDLKRSYDFRRIQVDMEIGDDLPEINCTETEIEQVILNLLRNSAQAMASAIPPVAAPRIDIRLSARPGGVCIEVEDNGPGIPPGVRHRIFEPFFTTKAPGVGTGLGLSVSYFIVTKGHGGTMRVESTPGSGTTFIIDLPTEETRP